MIMRLIGVSCCLEKDSRIYLRVISRGEWTLSSLVLLLCPLIYFTYFEAKLLRKGP